MKKPIIAIISLPLLMISMELFIIFNGKTFAQQPSPDKGIGPVKSVTLGPINEEMVKKGKALFNNNCAVCHSLNQAKIGPSLGDVTKKRTPEFIMNMILNPLVMEKKDSIIMKLKSQYDASMVPTGMNQQQARDILEYLRSVSK